jgi:2-polyprenyl-6-methoxyphenol hydroxylase-like FAD-dependent oxidoreductase
MNSTPAVPAPRALISGASFAGLTAAFWMRKLGYRVTVVETGAALKKGGTPVDIRDDTIGTVERMGLLEAIKGASLPPRVTEFTNLDGGTDARLEPEPAGVDGEVEGYEIPRDDLLAILFDALDEGVEVLFDNSIATLTDVENGVHATFRDGSEGDFEIVLGCDGNHSTVRKMRFGPEVEYSHFLNNYFTVAIVDETLIEKDTTEILSTPGRTLLLNSYEDKTDISLTFHADAEIPYDYHDVEEQKRIVRERFADAGARFTEMVAKAETADNFYFDKLSQTKMPHWTSGRVALVGDAGYCASPAAGMGGSLAIIGATALFDALQDAGGDIEAGFANYETNLRPVVEQIQAGAVDFGLATFFPASEEAIQARNAFLAAH